MRRAAAISLVLGLAAAATAPAEAAARTWHVESGADRDGNGSRSAPFDSLVAVEAAARSGDRILVRGGRPPLDGGIRLGRGQTLAGVGKGLSRLTNTTHRRSGDAVRLADRATVRGLAIVGPRRGGVYGRDVDRVTVTRNAVSGHNTSCAAPRRGRVEIYADPEKALEAVGLSP